MMYFFSFLIFLGNLGSLSSFAQNRSPEANLSALGISIPLIKAYHQDLIMSEVGPNHRFSRPPIIGPEAARSITDFPRLWKISDEKTVVPHASPEELMKIYGITPGQWDDLFLKRSYNTKTELNCLNAGDKDQRDLCLIIQNRKNSSRECQHTLSRNSRRISNESSTFLNMCNQFNIAVTKGIGQISCSRQPNLLCDLKRNNRKVLQKVIDGIKFYDQERKLTEISNGIHYWLGRAKALILPEASASANSNPNAPSSCNFYSSH